MTYQVLARKWRPKTFADLVGQEHVVQALRNALAEGRLHHAYLLTGTRGVGKTTIARILAKSLNCESAQAGEPCGVCPPCTAIDQSRFVDVLEIDAASNTGIDNIREVLENAQYAPTAGRYKVYIIDEVHMLSKPAFNAMLKTLEEPPEHVKFILATTDPHKVPVTVLSRCLQFVLRNMTAAQVAAHLSRVLDAEGAGYENGALALIGRAAAGSMRDALSLLDQAIALGQGRVAETDVRQMIGAVDKSYLYCLLRALVAGNGAALMAEAERMAAAAVGFDHALNELALLLQQLALQKRVPSALSADDPEWRELSDLADTLGEEEIQLYYQCAVHGRRDLPLAPDEYAGFVMTLLRMLAFAPLAAAAHPADAQIGGTELADPQTKPNATAGAPSAAPPTNGGTGSNPTDTAAQNPNDTEPPSEPPPTGTGKTDNPPEKHPTPQTAVTGQTAEPPPADTPNSNANIGKKAKRQTNQTADKPSSAADFLPPLTAENWVDIAEILMNSSGRNKTADFLQTGLNRMAFCAWDEDSGRLTLAVEPAAAALQKRQAIKELAERLGRAYGRVLHIVLADWSEAAAPADTVELRRLRRLAEKSDDLRTTLEADQAARDLLHLFDGQWLPESLRETDGTRDGGGQNP